MAQLFCETPPQFAASLQDAIDEFIEEQPADASDREIADVRLTRGECASCHSMFDPLAYGFEQFDYLEANGKPVLENATIVIGTEYGWNHSKQDVFHAVIGGAGRYNSGFFSDRTLNRIDLYNAILEGYGVTADIGSATNVPSEGNA